jgi:hypothetical protein
MPPFDTMPVEIVTTATLVRGRLKLRNWNRVASELQAMRDCELLVTITRNRATRSLAQNRWYWGCLVGLVAEHTGYTADEIHEIYKGKFLPKRLAMADGHGEIFGEFVIGGSTTRLNTEQFSAYCESIREWAADELGVVIPDPQ